MKSRRCCTLWAPAPRSEVPERPRNGERVHSGDTPREGHLLVGRASTWAAGDLAHAGGGRDGAAFAAFRDANGGGGGGEDDDGQAATSSVAVVNHVALGFPGIPPLTSEVLAEAMDTLQSCLRSPPSTGSLGDGTGVGGGREFTPVPSNGHAGRGGGGRHANGNGTSAQAVQPDAAVLAEELRKEGVRLVKVGQPGAAELVYSEAIKVAPHTPMLYFNRAACYARLGRHADALADARTGIKLAPRVPRGHWQEALALEAQGRYEEALGAYERACAAARDGGADEATLREYEARRDGLRRTTLGHADAAARVARVLKDAEQGKVSRGIFPEARRAAAVLKADAQLG